MKKHIKIIELFSGIGGFSCGLIDAGYTFEKHYFSEIDKHAIANYKYNFNEAEYIGPVQDVQSRGIERPDIITFGSPCQDFSLAGKRLGMDGKRSSLITEAIRIVTELKPSVFIWENVKGAFSSNSGADFWAIIQAFANIGGYRLEWQLCNTSWFLPQNRERIYLIGHLAGFSEPGVFPFTESNTGIIEGATNTPIVRAITAGGHSGGHHSGMTLVKHRGDQGVILGYTRDEKGNVTNYHEKDEANTLHSGSGGGGSTDQYVSVKPVLTPNRLEKRQNGRRMKEDGEDGEDAFTVTSQDQHGVMVGNNIRRLTEIECERLQGFPDSWTKFGNYDGVVKQIPKTQRYKLCGNAVTTNVVKAIAERLNIIK